MIHVNWKKTNTLEFHWNALRVNLTGVMVVIQFYEKSALLLFWQFAPPFWHFFGVYFNNKLFLELFFTFFFENWLSTPFAISLQLNKIIIQIFPVLFNTWSQSKGNCVSMTEMNLPIACKIFIDRGMCFSNNVENLYYFFSWIKPWPGNKQFSFIH